MRRCLTLLAVFALLGVAACEPQKDDGHNTPRRPGAPQAQPTVNPGNQQPAPVQGDPNAHNTQPGHVGLFVTWRAQSRATPICEWTRNGAVQPCGNIEQPTHQGNTWIGVWEYEEPAQTGWTYTLNAQGPGAITDITCEISWKGQIIPGVSAARRCGVSYQLN